MPQVLLDLLEVDPSEIRRRTRCSLKEAREVQEALREGVWAVLQFPDLVAQLLEDPQPRLLRKFSADRPALLRKVRRGQRLVLLRELTADGQLDQFQARDFIQGLQRQGEHWQALEKLYSDPGDDFWQKRPQPKEAEGLNVELVFAPENFDSDLVLEWLRKGQHREAVRWIRQLSGAPREDCQALVDRLEEAAFDRHPDPWRLVSRLWPGVVAPLAGLPNPDWLEILEPQRAELLDRILNGRLGPATQLVAESIPCSPIEARRFLRLLQDDNWDRTLEIFTLGQVFPKPRAEVKVLPPRPKPPEPAPIPPAPPEPPAPVLEAAAAIVAAATPEFTGAAPTPTELSPWAAQREQERLAAAAARELERRQAEQARAEEREASDRKRHAEMEAADQARHNELGLIESARQQEAQAVETARQQEGPQKLDLNDLDQVSDRLTRLAAACQEKNTLEALFILEELEQAGLNRSYVAARFPAILPWLPDDPWSKQIDKLEVFAPILSKLLKGEVNPTELAKQWVSGGGEGNELEQIVGSLEKAWKSKKRSDTEAALDLLKQHPHLAEQINTRVPWLADLMDFDHDGTPDIIEAYEDPGAYFGDLMRSRFPELEARLGEARIQKIKELLPELLETMKERNMRGVMRVLSRLRLGPSDVKALLGALKHMHR